MKKNTKIIIFFIISLALAACSSNSPSPERTLRSYLSAVQSQNTEKAIEFIKYNGAPDQEEDFKEMLRSSIEEDELTKCKIKQSSVIDENLTEVIAACKLNNQEVEITYSLEKAGKEWKVLLGSNAPL